MENWRMRRETGLRNRSMKFREDQMVRVHTCDGVHILTCVVEINTRRATPNGWEARGGRAPFTNASHRLNGVRSPIEVRKIVAQARATPSGFFRADGKSSSSLLLPSTERSRSKFRPDQSSAATSGKERSGQVRLFLW